MPRPVGPHTRNQLPGVTCRGSRKRLEQLEPFDDLPINFWLVIGVALSMLALTVTIIYHAM